MSQPFRYDGHMRSTNQQLKTIMRRHKLSQRDVQELLGRSRTVVYYWTRKPKEKNYQKMHRSDLRLLQLELGLVKRQTKIRAHK